MLSILMPAFNAERYLPTTLESLLGQDETEFEIVVCDDGSIDRTAAIVASYAARDARVRLHRQAHAGASAARNAAFSMARGTWILYFDADDVLSPASLGALMRVARAHPEDVVCCAWTHFETDPRARIGGTPPMPGDIPGWLWVESAFLRDYPTYPGSFVVPRRWIERCGGWDERVSYQDDMEFYARILSRVETVRFCDGALFCYRRGVPGSVSNTGGRRSSESQWLATRLAVQHLLRARDTRRARRAAARQLMLVSYAQFLAAPDISREAEALAAKQRAGLCWRPWLPGGPTRRLLQSVLGWKLALKTHAVLRRLKG